MVWMIIVAVIWLIGVFVAYGWVFDKKWEYRLWYSVFWPVMIPLWVIHKICNRE